MGNWKMNKDLMSATGFVEDFHKLARDTAGRIDIVLFPPYPLIRPMVEAIKHGARWSDGIDIGAQDLHVAERGAFTGAVSGICLKSVGATWVIVGHSERRNIFGDDDAAVNHKLKAALGFTLNVVLCVGESLDVRDGKRQDEFVLDQLDKAFDGVSIESTERLCIAYEPIWAIGTGRNAGEREIEPMMALIRSWADDAGMPGGGENLRVLYGGSVNAENAGELFALEGVDGFLVGGASLEAFTFSSILDEMITE
jgi:triosephosphate isomerase